MATAQEIVTLALDSRHGRGEAAKYSRSDSQAALREGLIELNGGSAKFDARTMRSDRGQEIFAIVEEVIQKETNDYWTNNEIVNQVCEYRNAALGDELEFYVPDNSLFVVAGISEGNTGIRRQRYEGGRSFTLPVELRGIKIYEEMIRVMAGRVDFNHMIDQAIQSMAKDTYERIMQAWNKIGAADLGSTYVPTVTGTYDEATLLDLIAHVEAETNQTAVIYGTKKALRNLAPSVEMASSSAKDDLYNMGYFGRFYGTDCIMLRQTHKLNSTDMLLDDKTVYVMAANDKPIKYVTYGDGIILQKDPMQNADLTYEWLYTERTGVGMIINEVFGKYTFAN